MTPRVRRVVAGVLGRADADVDDATQLALIALIQALPSFRGECAIGSHASRIAVHTAIHARRRSRSPRDAPGAADPLDGVDPSTPADISDATERQTIVRELLTTLPPEQAEVLALRFMLGWSLEETAASMGTPRNTVRSRMRLAKDALHRRIMSDAALFERLEL